RRIRKSVQLQLGDEAYYFALFYAHPGDGNTSAAGAPNSRVILLNVLQPPPRPIQRGPQWVFVRRKPLIGGFEGFGRDRGSVFGPVPAEPHLRQGDIRLELAGGPPPARNQFVLQPLLLLLFCANRRYRRPRRRHERASVAPNAIRVDFRCTVVGMS